MLDVLLIKSKALIRANNSSFRRYFIDSADFSHRLNIILGQRGIGKTTTLAQLANKQKNALYLSLDDLSLNADLSEIIRLFVLNGGEFLYLDEIHKNPNIFAILKNSYDSYKDLKIIATGSSALQILKNSQADLSRRAIIHKIQGMSFREYLGFYHKISFDFYSLDELLKSHEDIAADITQKLKEQNIAVLSAFKNYLKTGYYPYFKEFKNEILFFSTLRQCVDASIDSDLLSVFSNLSGQSARKLKILLYCIAKNEPFSPNYVALKNSVEIADERTLKEYLLMLENAGLIRLVMKNEMALKNLEKATKIYLENTNLMYLNEPKIGNVRESFFANQIACKYEIYADKSADFRVGENIFEIGGAKKSFLQIKDIKNSFVVADDIEIGANSRIPLWLFGFLY